MGDINEGISSNDRVKLDARAAASPLTSLFTNPFAVYAITFSVTLGIYGLNWSTVFPPLTTELLLFITGTSVVALLLAFLMAPKVADISKHVLDQIPRHLLPLLLALFAADFIHNGGVPLLDLLRGKFDPNAFRGVPTLHTLTVTLAGAFSTIRFADFLHSKRGRHLAEAVAPLVYFLLVVYRGPILIALVSWAFVFIIINGLSLKRAAILSIIGLGVLYLFGVMGNAREGGSRNIEVLGKPTEAFRASLVPRPFFWTYVYAASPLANLQIAVNDASPPSHEPAGFAVGELLPDFVSKRLLPLLDSARAETPQASPGLTVATIYGRAFVSMGWAGALTMFVWLITLSALYLRLIRASPYRVPCLALLNTLIVFCIFQNMIAHSPMSLQLLWPLAIGALPALNLRLRRL